jgi:Cu(I)/Ag(I) efflux system membrane fusion protein
MEPRVEPDALLPEGKEAPPRGTRTMAIARWALVGIMGIGAVAICVQFFRDAPRTTAARAEYRCPMHPSVTADSAGACPICGMDLVRIPRRTTTGTAAEAAGPSGVPGLVTLDLSPERVQLLGMRTAIVTREKLGSTVRTVGVVAPAEGASAVVGARFSGWVEKVLVERGRPVRKGQTLARIDCPELLGAQQAYLGAVRWLDETAAQSRALEGEARARLQLAGISDQDIEAIRRSGKPLRALSVRAPITGHIASKGAIAGLYVQPGTELFRIVDLSAVSVVADVDESDVDRVKEGQTATVSLPALRGETFAARVSLVSPAISSASRTLQIGLDLKNPRLRLRPGMSVDVTVQLDAVDAIAVPAEAVVDTGAHQYVFVTRGNGRFEPRLVKIGMRAGDKLQLLKGAREGETVVTTANFLVDSESRLRAAIDGISASETPAGAASAARGGESP